MKRTLMISLAFAALLGGGTYNASAQYFSDSSLLDSGKWVKVFVDNTGLYEISYAELEAMGFSDPTHVSVFGNGGTQLSLDFCQSNGTRLYTDELRQLSVINDSLNKKIYFYGRGVENYSYNALTGGKGGFVNNGLNIYSRTGCYFITDSQSPKNAPLETTTSSQLQSSPSKTEGVSLIYHEEDLYHNSHAEGQLFWGENFNAAGYDRLEWDYYHPDMNSGEASLNICFYADKSASGNLVYGLTNATGGFNSPLLGPNGTYFSPFKDNRITLNPSGNTGKVYVGVEGERTSGVASLDYWSLTFSRNIPTLGDGRSQDIILFPNVAKDENLNVVVPSFADRRVVQVSDPWNMTELSVMDFGPEGRANFTALTANPSLLYFNPNVEQKRILGWENVANQNVHSILDENPEMLIITLPHLRHLAEELADVHRRLEGMRVSVVNATEMYNEFSAGMPDPMAYRALVTYLYNNQETPLKNVLLYGPIFRDMRGLELPTDPKKVMIGLQDALVNLDSGALPACDLYGSVANTITNSRYEQAPIKVGVGILSVENETDAAIIKKKVEDFITDDTYAYRLNKYMVLGGAGDSHTHDNQAITMGGYFKTLNFNGAVVTPVLVDAYGNNDAREKLYSTLESGVMVWQYFGHGSARMLGLNGDFFSASRVGQLRNTALPFIGLAGCDLSCPDRRHRGIAEAMLLNTPNGGVAVLSATRSSWSGQNMELTRTFHNGFTRTNVNTMSSALREKPLSLGEIYAIVKNASKLQNELAYAFLGDPALVVPANLRKVSVGSLTTHNSPFGLVAGLEAVISGEITDSKGGVDTDYNGEVVLRLIEPGITMESPNLVTGDADHIPVEYNDVQSAITAARVENGRFSATIHVPAELARFVGKDMRLVSSAYDASTRIGAVGEEIFTVTLPENVGIEKPEPDTTAPIISEFAYDPSANILRVVSSDETALNLSESYLSKNGFEIRLDGSPIASSSNVVQRMGNSHREAIREVGLGDIAYGSHTALVKVADAAGNVAEAECRFEVVPGWAELSLDVEGGVAHGSALFNIGGRVDDQVSLFIMTPEGREVYRTSVNADTILWDCCDLQGNPVAPGRYKVFVRETGSATHKAHSSTITISVI